MSHLATLNKRSSLRDLLVYLNHSGKKKRRNHLKNEYIPFVQTKQIISSIPTLIILVITSAIIPTISTIINQTTNIEHPPYNITGAGGYGLSMGHGFFRNKCQVNEVITSRRADSSPQLYICNTVDQLCRVVAAKKNNLFHLRILYIHFRNINDFHFIGVN